VAALLGQACVQFNSGRFQEALKLYKKVLQIHPQCPALVRLRLGLCRVRMQEFKKAQQAFDRMLQLDGNNVEALVASGILDLNSSEEERVHVGFEKMQAASEIYPYCSMALNHFFTNQHFMVEQLTEAALAATDHTLMKAQSYYNLARSCHMKEDYEMAARYYRASTADLKNPKDFILPYYGLGQVHLKVSMPYYLVAQSLVVSNCSCLQVIDEYLFYIADAFYLLIIHCILVNNSSY
jgi:RNA polymerase-associated protein CTR9